MSNSMEGIVYLRKKIHEYEQKITESQARRDSLDAAIHETQSLLNSARALLDDELRARQTTSTAETLGLPTLSRLANLSLTEAILEIVQASPGPIHADNVLRQLVQAGIRPKSKAPKNSVVSILLRHVEKGRIRKVGPNLFVGISTETDKETLAGT
jgi:hypothetical protein